MQGTIIKNIITIIKAKSGLDVTTILTPSNNNKVNKTQKIESIILVKLGMGLYGAWLAMACDQVVRSALVLNRYNSGKWKLIKLKSEQK